MNHRRRRLIVLFSVIAALLIGLSTLAYMQRGNLRALLMSIQYSDEELIALQEQSLKELFEKYGLDPLPQTAVNEIISPDKTSGGSEALVTEAEDASLLPGSAESPNEAPITEPEQNATDSVHPEQSVTTPKDGQQNHAEPSSRDTQKSQTSVLPKDVQKLVYSLYSLQSQYIGKLEGIASSTRTRFDALPSEKRNSSMRATMVKATLSQAISLEGQCDERVASILSEMRTVLKKHGMDDTVADNAENYYATQKSLLKAEYMRKYNKYLK